MSRKIKLGLQEWVNKNLRWLELVFSIMACIAAYIALLPIVVTLFKPAEPKPIIPPSAVNIQHEFVSVSANEYWHDTGITVRGGNWLEFAATGSWWNGVSTTGPDGKSGFFRSYCGGCPRPDGNLGELVGKIGNGSSFRIGSATVHVAEQDGNLLLAMNENTGPCVNGRNGSCYEDNNGILDLTVTVWGITQHQINEAVPEQTETGVSTQIAPSLVPTVEPTATAPSPQLTPSSEPVSVQTPRVSNVRILPWKSLAGYADLFAFSPNSTVLATTFGPTVNLWNMQTGNLQYTLRGHADDITSIEFSPDGQSLASGSIDKTIKLWNVQTGKLKMTLIGHNALVGALKFSPDGKTLASGSGSAGGSFDTSLRLWDVQTGNLINTLEFTDYYYSEVSDIIFSPNGRALVFEMEWHEGYPGGYCSSMTYLLDTLSEKTLKGIYGTCNTSWTFSRDSKLFIVSRTDIFDSETGDLIQTINGGGAVAISFDGKMLATAQTDDNKIGIWDIQTGNLLRHLTGSVEGIRSLAFSPDGMTFVVTKHGVDRYVQLYDTTTWKQKLKLDGDYFSMAISPDWTLVAYPSDRSIILYDVQTGVELGESKESSIYDMAFAPNSKILASRNRDHKMILWRIK